MEKESLLSNVRTKFQTRLSSAYPGTPVYKTRKKKQCYVYLVLGKSLRVFNALPFLTIENENRAAKTNGNHHVMQVLVTNQNTCLSVGGAAVIPNRIFCTTNSPRFASIFYQKHNLILDFGLHCHPKPLTTHFVCKAIFSLAYFDHFRWESEKHVTVSSLCQSSLISPAMFLQPQLHEKATTPSKKCHHTLTKTFKNQERPTELPVFVALAMLHGSGIPYCP